MPASVLAVREDEVFGALRELGLEKAPLMEAVRYGEWARASCHRFDPPTMRGVTRWGVTNRWLAILHEPKGWKQVIDKGTPFIVSPDERTVITTTRGNHDTGNPAADPRTLFKRGPVAVTLTRRHRAAQFEMIGLNDRRRHAVELNKIPDEATAYYLLVNRRGPLVHAELSVPGNLDGDGRAMDWKPRIILGPFEVGTPNAVATMNAPDRSIEIDVTPRIDA